MRKIKTSTGQPINAMSVDKNKAKTELWIKKRGEILSRAHPVVFYKALSMCISNLSSLHSLV
jgi:hypothetical protein